MRLISTTFFLFLILSGTAQKVSSFKEVLKTAPEISITDSLLINYLSLGKTSLDHATGESFYKMIYRNEKQTLQQAEFFIAGKITSHKDFDILLLCFEQSITTKDSQDGMMTPLDHSVDKELFIVLLDKEGNYKNNFLGAMNYEIVNYFKKTALRNISTCVYKDFKIVQYVEAQPKPTNFIITSSMKEGPKKINFSMEYHINDYGVFVAYPKFKNN